MAQAPIGRIEDELALREDFGPDGVPDQSRRMLRRDGGWREHAQRRRRL
ncbi:MAG: hypothetical protein U5M50_06760 [Sphingobium sp.]|nr:hypothetical protein [Sphingobium sp.]